MSNKCDLKLTDLFITFFKIGLFTFGGGYAMIPLIEDSIINKKKWINKEEMLNIIAISESTPGPISVNISTFVGYKKRGILGAVISTLALVIPSFFIILIISKFVDVFNNSKYLTYAFYGIRICVVTLILKSLFSLYKICNINILSYIIMALTIILVCFFDVSAFLIIILSSLIGLLFSGGDKI